ncbi:MAG: hypothetical protein JXN61_05910 [Sedimentisphaerales bacterium]|nr:hypothetical protein [Sedimentisphaerales bacterium]
MFDESRVSRRILEPIGPQESQRIYAAREKGSRAATAIRKNGNWRPHCLYMWHLELLAIPLAKLSHGSHKPFGQVRANGSIYGNPAFSRTSGWNDTSQNEGVRTANQVFLKLLGHAEIHVLGRAVRILPYYGT